MNSASPQFVPSRRMGICDQLHQTSVWGSFKDNNVFFTPPLMMPEVEDTKLDNQSEDTSHGTFGLSNKYEQEESKPEDKVQRRLAQNREAARKSRLRKKAYVQQLENSKLRLIQLEQELDRARKQGMHVGGRIDASQLSYSGSTNRGITAFEMEYGHWVERQNKQICDLRNALYAEMGDAELRLFVDIGMKHYYNLFDMKATAAKSDVFYVMSGMWKSSPERFFLWIGGFRPSELLKVLLPHLEPLLEHQRREVSTLRQSCQQAEDALSQGVEKLQHILAEALADGQLGEGNYLPQIRAAMDKMDALARFMCQITFGKKLCSRLRGY
ncbi:TGACG-sequence-specific DNA-binding protein TGA-1A isoform X2 [Andrographis paniculata]|uniref:TGACG-sequence-specific DNA-binding protein TGA-1A isoform X2 n=1 Tax=Andrographis paniculata TaxID=175694 RepID=UPI0021E85B8B|nr:TGACG-sequence-specific DNA-binding protein TGA-1A isoform X2 [Andrographis paniculata]